MLSEHGARGRAVFTEVVKPSFFCMKFINVILYKEAVPRHKSISLRVFTFLKMHLLAFSLNSDFIKMQSIELGGIIAGPVCYWT